MNGFTRFKNLTNAKRFAAKTRQWVFSDEDGTGYIVVNSSWAETLTDSGLRPIFSPFDSIRIK